MMHVAVEPEDIGDRPVPQRAGGDALQVESKAARGGESAVAQNGPDQFIAQDFGSVRSDRDRRKLAGVVDDAVRFVGIGEVVVGNDGQAGVENVRAGGRLSDGHRDLLGRVESTIRPGAAKTIRRGA
jgi:hypothetical protein